MFKNRIFLRNLTVVLSTVLILFLVFFLSDNQAKASSFPHVHTAECYAETEGTCNHYLKDTINSNTYHCPNCGVERSFTQIIYWDMCPSGTYPSRDVAYKQYCSVCGKTLRNDSPSPASSHPIRVTSVVCGKETASAAEVSLGVAFAAPTNGTVTLTAGVNVNDANFSLAGAPYNFGSGYTSDSSYEVSENGTYSVSVMDSLGRVASSSVTVNNIDKIAPAIIGISKSTEDWSEAGVTITVEASDEGLGFGEEPYSYNGGAYTSQNSFLVTSNGTVTVSVKDAAGNVTSSSINISNVGRDPVIVARERAEAERIEAEKKEAERKEKERIEAEKKALEEKATQEKKALEEKKKKEKLEKEKKEKADKEKKEKEEKEKQKKNTLSENDKKGFIKETVSNNDVSGSNFVKIIDFTKGDGLDASKSVLDTNEMPEYLETDAGKLPIMKASFETAGILVGGMLILIGLLSFGSFSYVYYIRDGKKKILCLVKVVKSGKEIKVFVPKGKLIKGQNYLLFFSIFKRKRKNNEYVSIYVEGETAPINTDEGIAFKY